MARRLSLLAAALLLVLPAAPALANAPAPWWACADKAEGDTCSPYGGGGGTCVLLPDPCTDEASTPENECLVCEGTGEDDGCSGGAAGTGLGALAALAGLGLAAARRRRRAQA